MLAREIAARGLANLAQGTSTGDVDLYCNPGSDPAIFETGQAEFSSGEPLCTRWQPALPCRSRLLRGLATRLPPPPPGPYTCCQAVLPARSLEYSQWLLRICLPRTVPVLQSPLV